MTRETSSLPPRRRRLLAWMGVPLALVPLALGGYQLGTRVDFSGRHAPGDVIDRHNGVAIHYNGAVNHVDGRNLSVDGYNLGLRYQCVEFVKRYYYERLGHRMPDSYGHARDFFDPAVAQGGLNASRGLLQFRNGGAEPPRADDLLVFAPTTFNPYGHVAIVASVDDAVEIVQQNPGPTGSSRERFAMARDGGSVRVLHKGLLGWLRLPAAPVAAAANDGAASDG